MSAVAKGARTPFTLGEALDCPGLIWTTGGHLPWFTQQKTTHDGVHAAQSGPITHNQTSWIQTTVTGPGTLTFWWRVSSERTYDTLDLRLNNMLAGRISWTNELSFSKQRFVLPAGTFVVRWEYSKDYSSSLGSDCGWLDQVEWTPHLFEPPSDVTASDGDHLDKIRVAWSAVAGATSYTVYRNASNHVDSATQIATGIPALFYDDTPPLRGDAYYYWVVAASNDGTSGWSTVAQGSRQLTFAEALNCPELTWTTGGHQPWGTQQSRTYDGQHAAQTGPITHSQSSWLETTVTGPGVLTFWWCISSQQDCDWLTFRTNNVLADRISGTNEAMLVWAQKSYAFPSGTTVARWTYSKDASGDRGFDSGWLDQVEWRTNTVATATAPPIPFAWLGTYYPGQMNFDDLASIIGANRIPVWQSYVAGLIPTNAASQFTAWIDMNSGTPQIAWTPDLGEERNYTVEGKTNVTDSAWHSLTNSGTRFFRVKVGMP